MKERDIEVGDWCLMVIDEKYSFPPEERQRICKVLKIDYEKSDPYGYTVETNLINKGRLIEWHTSKESLTLITKEVADIMRGILWR